MNNRPTIKLSLHMLILSMSASLATAATAPTGMKGGLYQVVSTIKEGRQKPNTSIDLMCIPNGADAKAYFAGLFADMTKDFATSQCTPTRSEFSTEKRTFRLTQDCADHEGAGTMSFTGSWTAQTYVANLIAQAKGDATPAFSIKIAAVRKRACQPKDFPTIPVPIPRL
jgi:hypothetical protein